MLIGLTVCGQKEEKLKNFFLPLRARTVPHMEIHNKRNE
jgi:hypothetical protein